MKINESFQSEVLVTDIQRFCMHDGPGVRTTVFFKGCPLYCKWCHNPETQSIHSEIMFVTQQCIYCGACQTVCDNKAHDVQLEHIYNRNLCASCGKCATVCPTKALSISGYKMEISKIIEEVKKDIIFYGANGGLTVSGGEPTMQESALINLLSMAKEEHISTAIETCGAFSNQIVKKLCDLTDYFLFDIKDTNPIQLKENTGANYDTVISNLHSIDDMGGKTILRCILVPDVNMNEEHIASLANIYKCLSNCQYVEFLPYHPYGVSKGEHLGRTGQTVYQTIDREEVLKFASSLSKKGVPVKCYGTILS